jgi:hypothetical protein
VDDGQPNPKNPKHLAELSIVLSEMGLSDIKNELFENLDEEDSKQFSNPLLNKKLKYKNEKGEDKEAPIGNLLRLKKGSPGREAAEKMLPKDGSPERDALNKSLGGEKDGKSQATPDDTPKDGGEEQEQDPIQKAAVMFDPKVDPAMGARMDTEKKNLDKLAQTDKEKEAEATADVTNDDEDGDFNPIPAADVNSEMPQADPETFGGASDIPDKIQPEELHQFNTDIKKVSQIVAKAKENNQPIPDINLCDITVPGTNLYCDDNLGIPRDEMPQFKGKAVPGSRAASMDVDESGEVDTEPVFKQMLQQKGIKTLQTEVPADKLKATQKDLVGGKVVGMMGALEKDPHHPKITAPIYVSRDGYVIDGHHRWAAIVAYNAAHPEEQIQMKTTVLDQDIKDAIPMCNQFAEDMGVAAKKADANKEAPTPKKENNNEYTMTKENSELADDLMLGIIKGFISEMLTETNFPPGPKGTFWVRNRVSKNVYLVKTPKEAVHEKPSPKQIEKAVGELKAQLKQKKAQGKVAPKPAAPPAKKLGAGDFRDNPKEKDASTTSTQSTKGASKLELKYQNENAVKQMLSRDGKAQIRWMNGEETAPGTDAGAFNEVFGMTSAALIRKNPNITDEQIEKALRASADKGSVTKDPKVSGGDKMTAAIQTGRAIYQKTCEIAEEEGYDPKTLTQTGYWGSASSKASAIAQLAEMVKANPKIRFNGLTFDEYKKIILEGGGGEDPTDTMIVMHDGKSNNVAILHVSNKIGSNNIQANSTVKFTYARALDILDELQVPGKDKEQAYNFIKKHEAIGGRLQKEQKKYINSFLGEFAKLGAQNPKQFAEDIYADKDAGGRIRRGDEIDKAFKKSGAIGKACNGGKVKNKETGKSDVRQPFQPEGSIACSLVDNPNATPEQKSVALFQYYYALGEADRTDIEVPSFVREIVARSQDVKRDGKSVYDMGYDEKKVNELYGKMADELEGMRQDLNTIIPGMGDRILAQDIVERLHLGITEEDHLKNGIPSNRFILVMGNNEADIWYDKAGQAYEKQKDGYHKINDDGTNDKNPVQLKQKEVNRGNIATVGNAENFKNCLGVPEGKHVRQSINVKYEPVNLETGIINAHVFDINGVEKAVLVIRTKTGPGGDANDTVQFSKSMQNCMQKQEYLKKKRRNSK